MDDKTTYLPTHWQAANIQAAPVEAPVEVIVFDADGVLIPPWGFARYLQQHHPEIAPQTSSFFRGPFTDAIIGKADLREILPDFLAQWAWPHSLDEFLTRWFEAEKETNVELVAAIKRLREQGIRCYLATNQEQYRVAYMREQMGLGTLFDDIFSSCQIGCRKPDAAFYATVTAALALPPQNILFFDDTQANVDAARASGWQAELYTGYPAFVTRLQPVCAL